MPMMCKFHVKESTSCPHVKPLQTRTYVKFTANQSKLNEQKGSSSTSAMLEKTFKQTSLFWGNWGHNEYTPDHDLNL